MSLEKSVLQRRNTRLQSGNRQLLTGDGALQSGKTRLQRIEGPLQSGKRALRR